MPITHAKGPAPVPPALVKVGQHVLKRELHELKANGERPQHWVVAHDERLAPPSQCMGNHKLVKERRRERFPVDATTGDVEAAVAAI